MNFVDKMISRSTTIILLTDLCIISNDFDAILTLISRFSDNVKIILRLNKSRIIFSRLRIFMLIRNFARKLFTICVYRVSFAMSLISDINKSRITYSKQLCVAMFVSCTMIKWSVLRILTRDRIFMRYFLSIKDKVQSESTHSSWSDAFLNNLTKNVTKCHDLNANLLNKFDLSWRQWFVRNR
jgi:hypothetical protein